MDTQVETNIQGLDVQCVLKCPDSYVTVKLIHPAPMICANGTCAANGIPHLRAPRILIATGPRNSGWKDHPFLVMYHENPEKGGKQDGDYILPTTAYLLPLAPYGCVGEMPKLTWEPATRGLKEGHKMGQLRMREWKNEQWVDTDYFNTVPLPSYSIRWRMKGGADDLNTICTYTRRAGDGHSDATVPSVVEFTQYKGFWKGKA